MIKSSLTKSTDRYILSILIKGAIKIGLSEKERTKSIEREREREGEKKRKFFFQRESYRQMMKHKAKR